MTTRLARRVLVAAVLLFVPLLTSTAFGADLQGALKFVPADSMAVITVNGDKVKASPLFAKAQKMLFAEEPKAKKNLNKMKKATGFDVFRDVKSAVIAFGPRIDKDDDDFVAIIEAKISEKKIVAFIKKEGGKIKKVGNSYQLGRKGDGRMAFSGKYVVVGGEKAFARAMKKQGGNAALNAELKQFSGKDVAAAAILTPKMKKQLAREDKAFGKLNSIAAGLNVTGGLNLEAVGTFASAKPASKLANIANKGLTEVKKAREVKRMKVGGMLNKINVSSNGKKLTGKLRLTQRDVSKLIELLETFL